MSKALFLFIFVCSLTSYATAQLSGVKTIPGDYNSIAEAVTAINTSGVGAGGVTINITSGYTETAINITLNTTTSSQANPILIQKSGIGNNPIITAGMGSGAADGIFKIVGTDYVTIDGLSVQESSNNATNAQKAEWGFALLKASTTNGAQHNVIKNCTVELIPGYTGNRGIYLSSQNGSGAAVNYSNNPLGSNSFNTFSNNFITSCYIGISLTGANDINFSSSGYSGSDINNNVGDTLLGNHITGFGGFTSVSKGIEMDFQRNFMVANNVVDNSAMQHLGAVTGIDINASNNSSAIVHNNDVAVATNALNNASCYGIKYLCGSATASFNSNLRFSNNNVHNFTGPNAATGLTFSAMQIYSQASQTLIYNNSVLNNYIYAGNSTGGGINCISVLVNYGTAEVHHNLVNDNGYLNLNFGNADGISLAMGSSSSFDFSVHHNTVLELKALNVEGIKHSGGNNGSVYNNKVSELTGAGSQGTVIGLSISGGNGGATIYNNLCGVFATPTSNHLAAQTGIRLNPGSFSSYNVWHNTIFLQGNSTSNATITTALHIISTGPGLDIRNNILLNTFTAGSASRAMAIQSGVSVATLANSVLNYNILYAGTPSVNSYIFYYSAGSNANFQTFNDYQTTGLDAQSISGFPGFANTAGSSTDFLKPDELLPNIAEGSGTFIAAVPVDYDSVYRNASPDIGAYEIVGIPLSLKVLYFKGYSIAGDHHLEWAFSDLNATDLMYVERSADGRHFEALKKIAVNVGQEHYQYHDENPAGIDHYYRIQTLGADGKKNYTELIHLKKPDHVLDPVLFPNPANDFIVFENITVCGSMRILNSVGKLVDLQNILAGQRIDISALKAGRYYVLLDCPGQIQKMSFIKMD